MVRKTRAAAWMGQKAAFWCVSYQEEHCGCICLNSKQAMQIFANFLPYFCLKFQLIWFPNSKDRQLSSLWDLLSVSMQSCLFSLCSNYFCFSPLSCFQHFLKLYRKCTKSRVLPQGPHRRTHMTDIHLPAGWWKRANLVPASFPTEVLSEQSLK